MYLFSSIDGSFEVLVAHHLNISQYLSWCHCLHYILIQLKPMDGMAKTSRVG